MSKSSASVLQKLCMETSSNPLKPSYWKAAAAEFHDLRTLTVVAMLVAVTLVISNFFVPLGDNLKVFFTFLPKAVYCAVGGPLIGLAAGFISDIIGYMMHPDGGFFFGYTLSTMLGAFIYGLCFYRTKITLPRVIIAKASINLFVNMGLGCLWSQMIYGKGYLYYLAKSTVKNLTLLPIEIALLMLMFAALRRAASAGKSRQSGS